MENANSSLVFVRVVLLLWDVAHSCYTEGFAQMGTNDIHRKHRILRHLCG